MEIDEVTELRIIKTMDNYFKEISNPNLSDFAGGMYMGALKILQILNIEIEDITKFE